MQDIIFQKVAHLIQLINTFHPKTTNNVALACKNKAHSSGVSIRDLGLFCFQNLNM